jgi:hypothetical protein
MVKTYRANRSLGFLTTDAVVGLAIVCLVLIPLTMTLLPQQRVAKTYYERAVLLEILDGELEVLQAGAWRELNRGREVYQVRAEAERSLPNGSFTVELTESRIRLEWRAASRPNRDPLIVTREVALP